MNRRKYTYLKYFVCFVSFSGSRASANHSTPPQYAQSEHFPPAGPSSSASSSAATSARDDHYPTAEENRSDCAIKATNDGQKYVHSWKSAKIVPTAFRFIPSEEKWKRKRLHRRNERKEGAIEEEDGGDEKKNTIRKIGTDVSQREWRKKLVRKVF